MKEYKEEKLKSSEYYKEITAIEFYPESELMLEKTASKGNPIYKYGLFTRKKIGEEKEDLFKVIDERVEKTYLSYPIEKLDRPDKHYVLKDGKVILQAHVKVKVKDGIRHITSWFDSNDKAYEELERIKEKCSQCGNKLL